MEDCGKLGILGLHEAFIFRLRLQANERRIERGKR